MKTNPLIVKAYFKAAGMPEPYTEYMFHPTRKWRFDFCWPDYMVALEVEGGCFVRGRHSRGAGMRKDMEKYNEANILQWHVLRRLPEDLLKLDTVEMVRKCIENNN